MNFCDNCGADLKEHKNARFCYECGNTIEDNTQTISSFSTDNLINNQIRQSQGKGAYGKTSFESGYNSYGVIFTNLNALANSLNCGVKEVESVILKYISQMEDCGHQYVLLDACNNSYGNLDAFDGWQNHVDLLKKFHNDNAQAKYLFIVGGHDVIPMAIINNEPECYTNDDYIDTDMPYSYLQGIDFEELLWSGNLFKKEINLYCGRLPIPLDKGLNDIKSYFANSLDVKKKGIDLQNFYGITAKSWELASSTIIKKVQLNKKLHTSPEHNINSAQSVFNNYADFFYFNLHGSDSPGSPEFFGDHSAVISPNYLNNTENLNFLITEACYGAKFIDYATSECMLLTSLYNKTVAYVGSSKVAFGANSENISSADVVAKSYIENILNGETCGKAFAYSRVDVFDSCPSDHFDYGTTSAAEFNLFGDPCCAIKTNNKFIGNKVGGKHIRSKSYNNTRPEKKEIKINSNEKGILNDVRNLVNQEVIKIREMINQDLYSHFNIEARDLSSIFEIKNKYGEISYNFNYYKTSPTGKQQVYAVFTDKMGKIKSTVQSK